MKNMLLYWLMHKRTLLHSFFFYDIIIVGLVHKGVPENGPGFLFEEDFVFDYFNRISGLAPILTHFFVSGHRALIFARSLMPP